jgi:hypothetical protein
LKWRQNAYHGMTQSSTSTANNRSHHEWARSWSLSSSLWMRGSCGCDADREDNQLRSLHQDADRILEALKIGPTTQESNKIPPLAWKCKAAHKFEDSEGHHQIWLDRVNPSSLLPHSSTLTFLPIWSIQECTLSMELETDDDMISVVSTWLHDLCLCKSVYVGENFVQN